LIRLIRLTLEVLLELLALPFLLVVSGISRLAKRPIDVGLGPEPLINNIYHKKALQQQGYSTETFVHEVYHITQEFDVRGDLWFKGRFKSVRLLLLYVRSLFRYRLLYFYFHGSSLGQMRILWLVEPFLLRLAGIKTVLMPYGSDVQDLLRTPNLAFRHVLCQQYRRARWSRRLIDLKIDLWTCFGNHIISGCDWVDYMYHWDTLVPAHFSIDVSQFSPSYSSNEGALKVLHAPNHRQIKGSDFFISAVKELKAEGYAIDLILVEKVSNRRVKELVQQADVIADQLIIGWYAMFALEAMAMGKPVICYLRPDLLEFYQTVGVLSTDKHPIISATPLTVKAVLRKLVLEREPLEAIGKDSRAYVERYHSTEVIGKLFDQINRVLLNRKTGQES
jgi:glycosyltransferase involved in cell wall biosynthesis